jgi:Ca2+-binding EF-hand superfamily protein
MARAVSQIQPGRANLKEHHEWALKLWKRMDRDDSESITRKELDCEEFRDVLKYVLAPQTAALGTGGAGYARSAQNITNAMDFCLRKADFNDDRSLSFEEFKCFLVELRSKKDYSHTAELIFAMFDLDCDCRINQSEFREIYRYYVGQNPTADEFLAEWMRLDKEGNGMVTKEEYIKWLKTNANPVFRQHARPLRGMSRDSLGSLSPTNLHAGSTSSVDRERLPGLKALNKSENVKYRPSWNQNFNTRANSNHEMPMSRREYFSRQQSLPELSQYFETRRGFSTQLERMQKMGDIRRYKGTPLSTDTNPDMIPSRAVPGGTARNPFSNALELWDDHWQEPAAMKKKVLPVTLLFRCPGKVPDFLVARTEEDY